MIKASSDEEIKDGIKESIELVGELLVKRLYSYETLCDAEKYFLTMVKLNGLNQEDGDNYMRAVNKRSAKEYDIANAANSIYGLIDLLESIDKPGETIENNTDNIIKYTKPKLMES